MNDIVEDYFELLNDRINHVIRTQKENIYDAAKVCASIKLPVESLAKMSKL